MSRRTARTQPRGGFFLTDLIIGIGLLVVLAIVLTAGSSQYRRGSERLADSRQATRLAEQVMLALQSNEKAPTAGNGETIEIVRLPETRDLPPGCAWARVGVHRNGRSAELIGLVHADAIPAGARP